MSEKEITLHVIKIKVPITREDGVIIEGIDYASYEVTEREPLEIKSIIDLPNQTQEIDKFNKRQVKYAEEDSTRDYILRKIIQK